MERKDEPMNSKRDRALPLNHDSYVLCHQFAICTCRATDLPCMIVSLKFQNAFEVEIREQFSNTFRIEKYHHINCAALNSYALFIVYAKYCESNEGR